MSTDHRELVDKAYGWLLRNGGCGFAFKELMCAGVSEIPDVIGFRSGAHSVVVECKVSRGDFFADRNKRHRSNSAAYPATGMYRFYAAPAGLVTPDEIPDNWGLLEVSDKGRMYVKHNPYNKSGGNVWSGGFADHNIAGETRMMYSALRRLHLRGHLDSIYESSFVKQPA